MEENGNPCSWHYYSMPCITLKYFDQFVLDNVLGDVTMSGSGLGLNAGESFLQISQNVGINKAVVTGLPWSNQDGSEFLASAKSGVISLNSTSAAPRRTKRSRIPSAFILLLCARNHCWNCPRVAPSMPASTQSKNHLMI